MAIMLPATALLSIHISLAAAQGSFTTRTPPGPGDLRSPCPGLNSLANHGFLPHDGKGMTIPVLVKGLADGLDVGADFPTVIGTASLLSMQGNALTMGKPGLC